MDLGVNRGELLQRPPTSKSLHRSFPSSKGLMGILGSIVRKTRMERMRGYPQWRWHLDEVFVKIKGRLCYLWRAVDHEGEVLESVVTAKRDKAAALGFLKRIMKKYDRSQTVVTDGLCSYPAALKEIGMADRHVVGRRLNNRAENSHQPF
jgi:putative transposase